VKTPKDSKEFAATSFGGVPVFLIDDKLVNGFSINTFIKVMKS